MVNWKTKPTSTSETTNAEYGGKSIDHIVDYHNDVDLSSAEADPLGFSKVATPTFYQSGALRIYDSDKSHSVKFQTPDWTENHTITFPSESAFGSTDEILLKDTPATMRFKTIDMNDNTVLNMPNQSGIEEAAIFVGNGNATVYNIAHGMTPEPDFAVVGAASNDARGDFKWTIDATNIVVTYASNTPAGTGNISLHWIAGYLNNASATFTPTTIDTLENKTLSAEDNIITLRTVYQYIIYKDGSTYKAMNNDTGEIEFSNSAAHDLFNDVLGTMNANGGGLAFIKNATYNFTGSILSQSNTGLIGEHRDLTILRHTVDTLSTQMFRYSNGAGGAPLSKFRLENLTVLLNDTTTTRMAWYSSGTEYLVVRNCYFKSNGVPSSAQIMFFIDTVDSANTNLYAIIENNIFEGPTDGQDMLGCGLLNYSIVKGNRFVDGDGQAIGAANITYTVFSNNVFLNDGNVIGLEGTCNNNVIEGNVCISSGNIKLAQVTAQDEHKSVGNIVNGNVIAYGEGSIEAGHSSYDVITNNIIYRTKSDGVYGALEYSTIANNHFIETNYGNNTVTVGTDTNGGRRGGVTLINNTSWSGNRKYNKIHNNIFRSTNVSFNVPTGLTDGGTSQNGNTGGVMIGTTFENTEIYDNTIDLVNETNNKVRDHGINTTTWNNTGYEIENRGYAMTPTKRRQGAYYGNSTSGTEGALLFTSSGASDTHQFDTTHGVNRRRTTAASAGANAGLRSTTTHTVRNWNPRLKAKFKLASSATGQRLMIGFRNDVSNDASNDDDPLNGEDGIMLYLRSSDTVFQIARNDGSGATVFAAVSGSPAVDTAVHTIEIWADAPKNRWNYRFDNGNTIAVSTSDDPDATDQLGIMFTIQSQDAAAKSLDQYYLIYDSDN